LGSEGEPRGGWRFRCWALGGRTPRALVTPLGESQGGALVRSGVGALWARR
jgi:hypothetical protein